MFKNLSLEVDAIEGIGPAHKASLIKHNVISILDLIATPIPYLVRKSKEAFSEKELKKWCLMALFMQMDAIDGQYAEALARDGVKTISDIALKPMSQLKGIFEHAEKQNIIPNVPESETIFEMIREATILTFSQSFTGQVIDEDGGPVANAEVKVYYQKASTNHNGYVRLFGLVSEQDKMFIRTSDTVYLFNDYSISRYPDNIELQQLQLSADRQISTTPLSEFNGDSLPQRGSFPSRINNHTTESLRKGDIFLVRKIDAEANEITLQSIFSDFDGMYFIVNVYKYPLDKVGISAEERAQIEYGISGFKKLSNNRRLVKPWKEARKKIMESDTTSNTLKLTL